MCDAWRLPRVGDDRALSGVCGCFGGRPFVGLDEDGVVGPKEPDDYWAALDAWADAVDALWETHARPSPGGWNSPSEAPQGVVPRLHRMPWWVRVWYHTPFLDRRARAWMWSHGGFDVLPRSVKLPPQPPPPASSSASIVLPLTGQRVQLGEMQWDDPSPGLVHALGGSRITSHRRRVFNDPWASHVYGARSTTDPVLVQFSRPGRWPLPGRSKQADVVYGADGLWGAEIAGRWDVVEVSHGEQSHRHDVSSGRGWRLRRPRTQAAKSGIIFEP